MIQRLQQKRNEDGFTLIELLIVIIVLGILAAIVVFAIGSTRKDSVAASCKTNVKAVELSAEAVATKTGAYPTGSFNSAAPATSSILAPQAGALLKSYPSSSDYVLRYVEIPAVAGPPAVAQTYRVDVYRKGSTTVENADGTVTLGNGALMGSSGSAGCSLL